MSAGRRQWHQAERADLRVGCASSGLVPTWAALYLLGDIAGGVDQAAEARGYRAAQLF
eukprot:SAG22_NODE_729_length_7596_cov_20.310924_6_plen_58_part_00